MKAVAVSSLVLALAFGSGRATEAKDKTERKTVTVISAHGKLDGSTEISREAVKECIISLPAADALEADVRTESHYLKEINGIPSRNEWAKTYSARIFINYMIYRKDLLIIATKSVEGMEPTMKEVEKRLPQSREFVSNPAEGDTYAGRSHRQYYFAKAEDAVKDARARAAIWLKQQSPLLCAEK